MRLKRIFRESLPIESLRTWEIVTEFALGCDSTGAIDFVLDCVSVAIEQIDAASSHPFGRADLERRLTMLHRFISVVIEKSDPRLARIYRRLFKESAELRVLSMHVAGQAEGGAILFSKILNL